LCHSAQTRYGLHASWPRCRRLSFDDR
jgi:hypothetical protein